MLTANGWSACRHLALSMPDVGNFDTGARGLVDDDNIRTVVIRQPKKRSCNALPIKGWAVSNLKRRRTAELTGS